MAVHGHLVGDVHVAVEPLVAVVHELHDGIPRGVHPDADLVLVVVGEGQPDRLGVQSHEVVPDHRGDQLGVGDVDHHPEDVVRVVSGKDCQ